MNRPSRKLRAMLSEVNEQIFSLRPANLGLMKKTREALKSVTAAAVWRGTVRRRSTSTPRARRASIRIACVATFLGRFVSVWAPDTHHILVCDTAMVGSFVTRKRRNGRSELALENDDSLLDDHIRFEVSDAFDVEVEVVRFGIVVKRLVCRGSLFPSGILRDGPLKHQHSCSAK